ncbi:hypothetical protein EV363DRAFT_963109 [Boletus edulis]|uniref:Secreted protein n=1 Tax=Boletus edulis BED1 TaxID=1328754 RepID=A0AAD4BPU9_BOLED|nr:hypothetical protein EV363DRAFT_1439324 [Boletus edulis]KAF8120921.1 hypothetical protein EV363DRAFT_963109 [Boletus edulis]KAF8436499.1 hypothetical protein L210DRAFT_2455275 [Boletus edulis BED1]
MQSSSGFTFSKFLLVTLVVLMAWTAVVQGAAISSKRVRTGVVDFAEKNGLSRRVDPPVDDLWYTMAASKREEVLAGRDDDLPRLVDAPVDVTARWYTTIEHSAPTERDLSRRQETESMISDAWYVLVDSDTETGKTEGSDLSARLVNSPVGDRELWYSLAAESV